MNEKFTNFGFGVYILKSQNSLFNADFAHEPRQLPDENGTFYATDKSVKYCVRKYIHDVKGEKNVFYWRRNKDNGAMDLGENYNYVFNKSPEKKNRTDALQNLLSCWDVRVFGGTFPEKETNISITGTTQLTYGINISEENQKYSNQILSPFRNSSEKKKQENQQKTTIGTESKALESHLAFDYIINPKTNENALTTEDVRWFKEGLCKGVSYVNSASKVGTESEFLLYIEDGKNCTLPLLKKLIKFNLKDGKTELDLKSITEILERFGITHVEMYYEPELVSVINFPKESHHHSIHTLKRR